MVDGSKPIATVPALVAADIRRTRPHLRTTDLPFTLPTAPSELLWPLAVDGDGGARFVREMIVAITERGGRQISASDRSRRVRAPRRTSP